MFFSILNAGRSTSFPYDHLQAVQVFDNGHENIDSDHGAEDPADLLPQIRLERVAERSNQECCQ